jgi:NAD-dependent SIR2 family protein deacetylase
MLGITGGILRVSTRHKLRVRVPPPIYEQFIYAYRRFVEGLRERDLGLIANSTREMGYILRKVDIPSSLKTTIFTDLEREIESISTPISMYEDLRHIMINEFDIDRVRREKEEAVKEAKKILEKKMKKIDKLEINSNQPVLFFLGAGASKPSPSNIPTVSEMLTELWNKSNKMETKPLAQLETWCKENRIENIEEMLTGVTLSDFMIRNRKVHGLLNSVLYPEWRSLKDLSIRDVESVSSFQNMIDTFFSLLVGTMLSAKPNPVHVAIVDFIQSFSNTKIVTTNYDVCLDQALDKSKISYSYIIGSKKNPDSVPLIKMHGSINWFYCQACQHILIPTVENMHTAIKNDVPYSVTGMCPICTAPTKQFIVPPTTYKFLIYPPIVQVWNAGREIFEKAKIYIIVGYSFSLADDYIQKMLLKAIREDPSKQLIIIDKNSETIEKFKHYVKTHTDSFNEDNFHSFTGAAEELVPKIITTLKKGK